MPRSEGNRRPEDPVDRKVAFIASADLMEQGKEPSERTRNCSLDWWRKKAKCAEHSESSSLKLEKEATVRGSLMAPTFPSPLLYICPELGLLTSVWP